MNARERAQRIVASKIEAYQITRHLWSDGMINDIERAIIAAEEAKAKEEREACVKLSGLIADKIWDYCQSVEWGTGRTMMEQREIEQIIIDTIRAQSEGEKKGE